MNIDLQRWQDIATAFGLKVLGALAVWMIGRWLIGLAVNLLSAGLNRQKVDPTLVRYLGSIVSVALNIILVWPSSATSGSRPQVSPHWWRA